jgi:hypothetical protein
MARSLASSTFFNYFVKVIVPMQLAPIPDSSSKSFLSSENAPFVEPNPGSRAQPTRSRFRYPGYALRFEVKTPTEPAMPSIAT